MNFNENQIKLIKESLKVYWSFCKQKMGPMQSAPIIQEIKEVYKILDNQTISSEPIKLKGLTDEQFENVCMKGCEHFENVCKDKVAQKFPGKCDPILRYENNKRSERLLSGKGEEDV